MKRKCLNALAIAGFAILLSTPASVWAQAYLGSTLDNFAVLGHSAVTSDGTAGTLLTGDMGISLAGQSATGFPPGLVTGGTYDFTHLGNATAGTADTELAAAQVALIGLPCTDLSGLDLGGLTLVPGSYCFSSSAGLTGTLTLDALGNPNAMWVFKIGSTLTTADGSAVVFINGSNANACGVQWLVGSSATIGANTNFAGNILAQQSISMRNGANVIGRALAHIGAVTLINNRVSFALCDITSAPLPFPPPGPVPVPTLPEWAMMALMALLALAGFTAIRRRTA